MAKTLLVYMDEAISTAVKKAVGRKGNIISIENLSHLHKSCRTVPADALFIGEEQWDVFGCTALHPDIAPHIHFPIILVTEIRSASSKKKEMVFRFVSVPEEQKSRTEAIGYNAALRPFISILSPLVLGAGIKVAGPNDLPIKAGESCKEKEEREGEIEAIRKLCGHKKCREIFDLILSCGEKGASINSIQLKIWPCDTKSRRNDIQSYICKIRKAMREHPEYRYTIVCKDGKYFFVRETGQATN